MSEGSTNIAYSTIAAEAPDQYVQVRWYAVQTGVNQERQVSCRLRDKGIESFVPLYEELRSRADRKIVLQVPLFAGYVFVHIPLCRRLQVLEVPRVVRLVSFGHAPVPVPDHEIEILRAELKLGHGIMPHPQLHIGKRVRVSSGVFAGLEGILMRRKGPLRILVTIDAISRSFSVEVDERELEPIPGTPANRTGGTLTQS